MVWGELAFFNAIALDQTHICQCLYALFCYPLSICFCSSPDSQSAVVNFYINFKSAICFNSLQPFLPATADIEPNWVESSPDPNVTIVKAEMVIRGYPAGHAWREYRAGKRMLCAVPWPEGLRENNSFLRKTIPEEDKGEQSFQYSTKKEAPKAVVKAID